MLQFCQNVGPQFQAGKSGNHRRLPVDHSNRADVVGQKGIAALMESGGQRGFADAGISGEKDAAVL